MIGTPARRQIKQNTPAKPDDGFAIATDRPVAAKGQGVQVCDVVEDEAQMRLDRWFRHRFPGLAMSHLNRLVRKGDVRVNG